MNNYNTLKILLVGAFRYPIYQAALAFGFRKCEAEVLELILPDTKTGNEIANIRNSLKLVKKVREVNPDLIFLYRVDNIWAISAKYIKYKHPNSKVFIYHNDDPFRKGWKRSIKHYHYNQCVKYADITYVYRQVNINEAYRKKAHQVEMFMSHYTHDDLTDYTLNDCVKKNQRVVFVGHYENDNRIEYIDYLFKQRIDLHIYGHDRWKEIFQQYGWPSNCLHHELNRSDYKRVVHSAAIAIAFFSVANRDKYTRRCFEIPIFGTLLLAPRTDVMEKMFTDGKDVVLYTTKEDLFSAITYYNAKPALRTNVTYQGYLHVRNGGFSEVDRARKIINDYRQLIKKNDI